MIHAVSNHKATRRDTLYWLLGTSVKKRQTWPARLFYAAKPNHQEVDRITRQGEITRVVDLSTLFVPPTGWQGPTSLVYHNGNFYFGTLGIFPVTPGSENIYQLAPDGHVSVAASGLTAVLGIAFDAQGRLYALETDTVAGFPARRRLVRAWWCASMPMARSPRLPRA